MLRVFRNRVWGRIQPGPFFETLVSIQQTIRCYILVAWNLNIHHHENLTSLILNYVAFDFVLFVKVTNGHTRLTALNCQLYSKLCQIIMGLPV
jgi:hypothetical protein